jgi:hypothetical protein
MYTVVYNFVFSYLKLLALAFLLEILKIFLCSLLVSHIKLVPPLGVHQLSAKILTYLVNIWVHLIIFEVTMFLVFAASCVLVLFSIIM